MEKFHEGDLYAASKAAEQTNIATVRRMLTALSVGDVQAFAEELDAEIELEITCPDYFPWTRTAKGITEMIAAVTKNYGFIQDQKPTIISLTAHDDLVEICADETGLLADQDRRYEVTGLLQFRFRNGKAIHLREIVADRATSSDA